MTEKVTPAAALGKAVREYLRTGRDKPVVQVLVEAKDGELQPPRGKDERLSAEHRNRQPHS